MKRSLMVVLLSTGLLDVMNGCTSDPHADDGSGWSTDASDEAVGALPHTGKDAGVALDGGSDQGDEGAPINGSNASFVCTDPSQILWDCSTVAELEARAASLCNQGAMQLKYDRDPACGGEPIAAWLSCCVEVGGSPKGPALDAGVPQTGKDAGTGSVVKDAGAPPVAKDAGAPTGARECANYVVGDGTCVDLDELEQRAVEACSAHGAELTHFEVDDDVCAGGAAQLAFECCALAPEATDPGLM